LLVSSVQGVTKQKGREIVPEKWLEYFIGFKTRVCGHLKNQEARRIAKKQ